VYLQLLKKLQIDSYLIVGDRGLISAFDGLSALFPFGLQVPGEKLSDQKVNRWDKTFSRMIWNRNDDWPTFYFDWPNGGLLTLSPD
jgi:hypothetical protein